MDQKHTYSRSPRGKRDIIKGMIRKVAKGFGYAINGFRIALRQEHNFQIQVVGAIFVFAASFFFNISALEFAVVMLTTGFILSIELLNTALEELCDKHTMEHDPHIGRIKDLAAAAVTVSFFFAVIVGAAIFLPYLLEYAAR
jgi:diacylglycerol kinase